MNDDWTHLATRSAFFPFNEAFQHWSHRFSWGTVKSSGILLFRLTPGMSNCVKHLVSLVIAFMCIHVIAAVHQAKYSTYALAINEYVPFSHILELVKSLEHNQSDVPGPRHMHAIWTEFFRFKVWFEFIYSLNDLFTMHTVYHVSAWRPLSGWCVRLVISKVL